MVGSMLSLFLEISKKVKDVSQSTSSMVSLSPPKNAQDNVFFRQLNALDDLYVNKDNEKFLRVNESLNQDHRRVSLPEPFQEDSQSFKILNQSNESKNEEKKVKVHIDKKKNHLKVMFPKLSRFLSASDRVLYKQAHRKDDDTILSKRHSDVMSHPDNVAVQQKVTELRKSSVGSSVSSSSSGAEAKIGFEVISDKKRRSYYFNESIDSAEDALHTIEEDTSLPIVVVHPSDKNMLRRGSSFSDSACSPSLPGDLLIKRGHILRNYPHENHLNFAHHKHHNDNNRSTVHSGPEIINGVSGSDAEHATKKSNKKDKPPKNEKKKKTSSWYNVLSPSYKSRSEDFKRIFKDIPVQERLLVEYSCALQKDILIQGRMYVSQSWICFYANIFRWETVVMIKCCDVIKLTKEKTARVIPNAIQISTKEEKYFFASFGARDKVFKQLELVRRNAQMGVVMNRAEFWSWVHLYYGDDLGLTSDDDDDYEPLTTEDRSKFQILLNTELDATVSLVEEATEAAVIFATHIGRSEETVSKEAEIEQKQAEVPPEDVLNESSDEEIVDYCSRHLHNSIEVLDEAYNIPVDKMFHHIFGDSIIFREFAKSNKMIDLKLNDWRDVDDDEEEEEEEEAIKVVDGDVVEKGKVGKKRQISYTLLLNLNFGPKQSPSREKQVMYADSEPGQFYLIDSDCFNDNIPYGENFFISNRYCISRLSNNRSRLKISSQIKYKKSVWGFVKNFLAKNVTGGINSTFSILADLLRLESDRGLLLTSRDDPVSDPFHRHLTSTQADVTDHVAPCKTNQTGSKRRHGDKESTSAQESRRLSLDERPPSLDTIVKGLLLLILVLLIFNGIFFYKLWNLELLASRLIKNHIHHTSDHHPHNLHHSSDHHNLYTNELHSHSSLEQMVKEQLKNGEDILSSDWLNNLDRKDSENDVWSSVRRKQYQRLLGNTLKLMESMRVTMEQLQKQLGVSDGGMGKSTCQKAGDVKCGGTERSE